MIVPWVVSMRPLIPVVVLAAAAVAAFWPSVSALAELWGDPVRRTYQHGYLVVAISVFLVYRDRGRLAALPATTSTLLFAAGLVGGIAWAIAVRAGLQTAHLVLWPLVLWCLLAGVMGWRAGRILMFPVAYLYLALPIWEILLPWLQHATVVANRLMIGLSGLPAWVEGNNVHLAAGTFTVEEGCSGLSYLVAGLSLAMLLGKINRDSTGRRWLLILLAAALSLFSNWVRVFVVIVAGYLTDMQHYFVKVDHIGLGWVLFALAFAGFFVVARRLPESVAPVLDPRAGAAPANGVAAGVVAAGVLALVAGPLLLQFTDRDTVGSVTIPAREVAGWTGPAPASDSWRPVFAGADGERLGEYVRGRDRVTAYVAVFMRQQQGKELTGYGNSVYGAAPGNAAQSVRRVEIDSGSAVVPVAEGEWQGELGQRILLWWTYQVGGLQFAAGLRAQVWYGVSSLVSSPVSSVVVLRADCVPDCESARATLGEFASVSLPALLHAAQQPEHVGELIQRSVTVPR